MSNLMAMDVRMGNDKAQHEDQDSYEKWYEQQCHFGYEVDEWWLVDMVDNTMSKVSQSNKLGLAIEAYVFDPSSTAFKPSRRTLEWQLGVYEGDSNVVWECLINLELVPEDSPLRLQYPLAFDAVQHGYIDNLHVDIANRYTRPEFDVVYSGYNGYMDGETVCDESIYGGMDLARYEELADAQMYELCEFINAVCEQASEEVTHCLWEDYEYHFSEQRYNEEN